MSTDNPRVNDELFADMLPDFLDEAGGILEQLNDHLLHLDEWVKQAGDGDPERCDSVVLNEMFRAAHTLKGLSGMLGLGGINALTHKVENIFDAARNDQLRITADVVDVTFQSVDRLHAMIDRLKEGQQHDVDCQSVLDQIQSILQAGGVVRRPLPGLIAPDAGTQESVNKPTELPDNAPVQAGKAGENGLPSSEFAAIVDDFDPTSKYVPIFIDETETTLDEVTEALLAGADENITERVLILCHRVKGSAAAVGLHRAAKMAHYMEDVLQTLRENGRQPTVEMTDALLDCTEALRVFVQRLKQGELNAGNFDAAHRKLIGSVRPNVDSVVVPGLTDALRSQLASLAPAGARAFIGQATFRKGLIGVGLKARLAYERVSRLGEIFYCQPADEVLDDLDDLETFTFGLVSDHAVDRLHDKLRIDGIVALEIELLSESIVEARPSGRQAENRPVAEASAEPQVASSLAEKSQRPDTVREATPTQAEQRPAHGEEKGEKPVETVRVDIDRLDQLMNLAGQLVINKAQLGQIATGLKQLSTSRQTSQHITNIFNMLGRLESDLVAHEQAGHRLSQFEDVRVHTRRIQSSLEFVQRQVGQLDGARTSVNEMAEALHQLDRVSDGIQKCVMDTRMVPIGPLFGRFKRVIRDISRGNGKEIRLVIRGEKTELDKRMIDELGDPLIHIIRNSADHGIELPDLRQSLGKPREGTVTLDASHRGSSIVIQIRDDGKGLDADKIRRKAVEKRLITPADAEKLSDHQAYQLIWEPGLSTAEKVTEVSGRGMGMDIVRSKIEEISGTVELFSTPGEGTTITIKLPLTLAILPSLLAVIEGDVFAVPVESVVEIVRVAKEDLSKVHGLETATVRGRVVSVVHLDQLFEWNQSKRNAADGHNGDDTKTLVIVGSDGREIGLAVDQLLGEDDVVIKSLADNYRNVEGVAGASILGNGRVSLILDVGAIVYRASKVMASEFAV